MQMVWQEMKIPDHCLGCTAWDWALLKYNMSSLAGKIPLIVCGLTDYSGELYAPLECAFSCLLWFSMHSSKHWIYLSLWGFLQHILLYTRTITIRIMCADSGQSHYWSSMNSNLLSHFFGHLSPGLCGQKDRSFVHGMVEFWDLWVIQRDSKRGVRTPWI